MRPALRYGVRWRAERDGALIFDTERYGTYITHWTVLAIVGRLNGKASVGEIEMALRRRFPNVSKYDLRRDLRCFVRQLEDADLLVE